MKLAKTIELPTFKDTRGSLVALEVNQLPFDVQRVYYLFGTPNGYSRGYHAHVKLKQLIICVSGQCRILLDDGESRQEIWLKSPTMGVIIDGLVWRELHDFSENAVLLVLASENFTESDYIRDYQQFSQLVHKMKNSLTENVK